MKVICGECPSEYTGCLIKFIKELRRICMCRNCLVKVMCKKMCEDRETLFIDLPDWVRHHLEEINHYHRYDGIKEFNKLMKDLETLVKEANIGAKYEE